MFQEIHEVILRNDSIVIFGHDFPDGDCYGSQIGLRDLLRINYPEKKVYAVGSGLRRFVDFIATMDEVSGDIIRNSLAIILDGNDLSRMEDKRVYTAKEWIKIDHHIENGRFTEGKFVLDTHSNSTCELIVKYAREMSLKVNPTICNALFLGMVTDSGRFQFIEDYPLAFDEAKWLCENGASPRSLDRILNTTSEDALRFKGYVYTHYKETKNGVIYLVLRKETLKKLHVSASKAGAMVNLLSNVRGHPIWTYFCENEDGTCHLEFRSNGPAVQPIAASYGGGGHLHAAGVTLQKLDGETIDMVLKDLDNAITEYKKENK